MKEWLPIMEDSVYTFPNVQTPQTTQFGGPRQKKPRRRPPMVVWAFLLCVAFAGLAFAAVRLIPKGIVAVSPQTIGAPVSPIALPEVVPPPTAQETPKTTPKGTN